MEHIVKIEHFRLRKSTLFPWSFWALSQYRFIFYLPQPLTSPGKPHPTRPPMATLPFRPKAPCQLRHVYIRACYPKFISLYQMRYWFSYNFSYVQASRALTCLRFPFLRSRALVSPCNNMRNALAQYVISKLPLQTWALPFASLFTSKICTWIHLSWHSKAYWVSPLISISHVFNLAVRLTPYYHHVPACQVRPVPIGLECPGLPE